MQNIARYRANFFLQAQHHQPLRRLCARNFDPADYIGTQMPGSNRRSLAVIVLLAASLSHAQKQAPAALVPRPLLILDSVVTQQWPAMLPAVNPPAELTVRHRANPRLEVRLRRLPRDEEARQDAGGLTPSLVHGLTYGAAHWSLASFYNSDPSAADYIRAIRDDSSTPHPSAKRCRISTRKARLHPATRCANHVVSRAFAKLRARVYSVGHNCIRVSAASAHERPMCSAPINDI